MCLRRLKTYSKQDLWTIKPHSHSAKAAVTNTVPTANLNSTFLKKKLRRQYSAGSGSGGGGHRRVRRKEDGRRW